MITAKRISTGAWENKQNTSLMFLSSSNKCKPSAGWGRLSSSNKTISYLKNSYFDIFICHTTSSTFKVIWNWTTLQFVWKTEMSVKRQRFVYDIKINTWTIALAEINLPEKRPNLSRYLELSLATSNELYSANAVLLLISSKSTRSL